VTELLRRDGDAPPREHGTAELVQTVGSNQAPATKKSFLFSNFREPHNHPN